MAINWRQYTPAAMIDRATARPGQTMLSAGAGMLGSLLGGPLLGQAASQGVRRMFDRRNDRQFDSAAQQLRDSGIASNNAAIWGNPSTSTPGGYTPMVPNSPLLSSMPSQGLGGSGWGGVSLPYLESEQPNTGGLPGITSPLAGSGYGPSTGGNTGWVGSAGTYGAGVGAYGAFHGVGSSPNPFNVVGQADRFSLAET